MAISKRKGRDGKPRYTVTINAPDPADGQWKRFSVGTYPRKADAEDAEREAKLKVKLGTFVPPSVAKRMAAEPKVEEAPKAETVEHYIENWLETRRMKVQPNTYKGYRSAVENWLVPAFGEKAIGDLTHTAIQQQVTAWEKAGKSAQLIHRCWFILRSALTDAIRDQKLAYNPADHITKPSVKKRQEVEPWPREDRRKFLEAAEGDQLGVFWYFALLEGMRRAEALGLRWSDLTWSPDESRVVAKIVQTVIPDQNNGGRARIQPRGKTKAASRVIGLTGATTEALKRHRDRQEWQRKKAGELWADSGLIVADEVGAVIRPGAVKRHLTALLEQTGLTPPADDEEAPKITTHTLRHMAATLMLKSGQPAPLVSHKIGHSSIVTTADIYGHFDAKDHSGINAYVEADLLEGMAETGS